MNFPIDHHPRPGSHGQGAPAPGGAAHVDAIVSGALSETASATLPTNHRRGLLGRKRPQRAVVPMAANVVHASRTRTTNSSPAMRMLVWGIVALAVLGGAAIATGAVQLTAPADSMGARDGASKADRGGAYSYFHDSDYRAGNSAPKWQVNRARTSDPDEAALGDTNRWEYDGPYRYGPYGSDGMRRRSSGRETADPLYSSPAPLQDVFTAYGGDLDPSGGNPVGMPPSSMTNPYYDPYAGYYTNPYANRIRMAFGEGYGSGAAYELNP